MATKKPDAPAGSATEERFHEFTEAQFAHIKPLIEQIQQAQQRISHFLGYIQAEAALPDAQWELYFSPARKQPCMRALVPK